jgi:hypothetical protein
MIIAVMLPSMTKIGILIDFKFNQDFIADMLCIDREKPMSTCNGKCYLSKQLKKAEEQEEKQAPASNKERLGVIDYCSISSFDFLFYTNCIASMLKPACVDEFYTSRYIADIFRPPNFNLI